MKLYLWLKSWLKRIGVIKNKSIEHFVEGILISMDRIFMIDCEIGTPLYRCQQSLMKSAARYRLSKIGEL